MTRREITIGTRRSHLAVWQAEHVAAALRAHHPGLAVSLRFFVTEGDRALDRPLPEIGGKGVFTAELERALRAGEIDLAVHSLKDLPTEAAAGLTVAATPPRATPLDVLISRQGKTLVALPAGAVVGTSSPRRVAQLRLARPDLRSRSIRGNVPTRLERVMAAGGPYDALILAAAGLERLGLSQRVTEVLPATVMLPAPGQGALAVQSRADDTPVLALLAPLDDQPTRLAVEAERAFLGGLGAGCQLPVAALAEPVGHQWWLRGRVGSVDGARMIDVQTSAVLHDLDEAIALGRRLAEMALTSGARQLLDMVARDNQP